MKSLKKVVKENVTKEDIENHTPNEYIVSRVYMSLGLDLMHATANIIVYGENEYPKLISVIRAIQKRKKELADV